MLVSECPSRFEANQGLVLTKGNTLPEPAGEWLWKTLATYHSVMLLSATCAGNGDLCQEKWLLEGFEFTSHLFFICFQLLRIESSLTSLVAFCHEGSFA